MSTPIEEVGNAVEKLARSSMGDGLRSAKVLCERMAPLHRGRDGEEALTYLSQCLEAAIVSTEAKR